MLYRDTDISRQLANERHADLKQDWEWVNPTRPDVVESRRNHRRFWLEWLRTQLRPSGHAPSSHTP